MVLTGNRPGSGAPCKTAEHRGLRPCTDFLHALGWPPMIMASVQGHSRRRKEAHPGAGPAPADHGGCKGEQRVVCVEGVLKGLEAEAHLQGAPQTPAGNCGLNTLHGPEVAWRDSSAGQGQLEPLFPPCQAVACFAVPIPQGYDLTVALSTRVPGPSGMLMLGPGMLGTPTTS